MSGETQIQKCCFNDDIRIKVCQDLPAKYENNGNWYCILHLPNSNKNKEEFFKAMDGKFKSRQYDFSYVNFPDRLNFKNQIFEGTLDFSGAMFNKPVEFSGCKFKEKLDFSGARFFQSIDFKQVSFSQQVIFNDAIFNGDLTFLQTIIEKTSNISFERTYFYCENHMNVKTVDFQSSQIYGYIRFTGGENKWHKLREHKMTDYPRETTIVFEGKHSNLSFAYVHIENPKKIIFQNVRLQPNWFVDTDSRNFEFIDCVWEPVDYFRFDLQEELNSIPEKDIAKKCKLLSKACRQLADNFESNNNYEEASLFRKMALESIRFQSFNGLKPWTLHWWYWLSSYYGESWQRALLVLMTLVFVIFPVIYINTEFQTCSRVKPIEASLSICESAEEEIRKNCTCNKDQLTFTDAIVQSLTTATLQNIEYRKPTEDSGAIWMILEKIFAPVQAALLALAVRRKFMR